VSDPGLSVIVIGAGIGGVAATIELQSHGFTDITVLEAAPDLGGTWFYNSYPGAACDIPSPFYSFSYAQSNDWTHLCSPQAEILAYIRRVADAYGVDRRIVTDSLVTECVWDERAARWTVSTAAGARHQADAIIIATGQLNQPAVPALPGADTFAGHSFHSARWDHDYDLRGKRVGVVGTGASAVQFVPEIAAEVAALTVFQRTGNWFMPRLNRPYPAFWRRVIAGVPGVRPLLRRFYFNYCELLTVAIRHPRTVGRVVGLRSRVFMRRQLRDPVLRRKAWPDYAFGCKRILFSSHFLPALQRPNVTLVTEPIVMLDETGVLTKDGTHHDVDCVIWATGFRTNDFMFPMRIVGRAGRTLNETWASGAHAHLGITVPGFPSMFVLYGPNTNTSGGSIIFYLEKQAAYVRRALALVRERGAAAIDVRPEVEAASDQAVQARFFGTAWTNCDSWYRDEGGRIVANWPGYMREYREALSALDETEFELVGSNMSSPPPVSLPHGETQ
jgi:cation diffusion facilitator CzcD-associated flavoprotein CzcO